MSSLLLYIQTSSNVQLADSGHGGLPAYSSLGELPAYEALEKQPKQQPPAGKGSSKSSPYYSSVKQVRV